MTHSNPLHVVVIGAGPAGLMAAEVMSSAGLQVDVYDAMPSAGRKFLLAGRGGLNLTHSEPTDPFVQRYGARSPAVEPLLQRFGAQALRDWAQGLGVSTFVGSSGRVFPVDLEAAPLLRGWLHRLRASGVRFHMRHRWLGFLDGGDEPSVEAQPPSLRFSTPAGEVQLRADAVVLALGGASWSRLGSDGAWVPLLRERQVEVATLRPSNCGFDVAPSSIPRTAAATAGGSVFAPEMGSMGGADGVEGQGGQGAAIEVPQPRGWTEHFRSRHEGAPLKNVALSFTTASGQTLKQPGEFVLTATGVEGSLIYALSGPLRDAIEAHGQAVALIDLLPQHSAEQVAAEVARPRGSRSLSTHLKSRLGIDGVKAALLHELLPREVIANPTQLAAAIKALPLPLNATRPIDEAISTAGGVKFEALDGSLMTLAVPGLFCCGEMLDWEAPTGGYLLTASFASGVAAAEGVIHRWRARSG